MQAAGGGVNCKVEVGSQGVQPKRQQEAVGGDIALRYQHAGSGRAADPAGAAAPAPPDRSLPEPRRWWRHRWLLAGLLLTALLVGAAVTIIVLYKRGVFSSTAGDQEDGLPYVQRHRDPQLAPPAFSAELHSWLLPREQAALGLSLDADVIIVGAGLAGLRAAQVLSPKLRVLVLEARDRMGGRIQSLPFGGTVAELGAQFILGSDSAMDAEGGPGKGNPLTEAANALGMTRIMMGPASGPLHRWLGPDGQVLPARQRNTLQRWQADLGALAAAAAGNQSVAAVLRSAQMTQRLRSSGGTSYFGSEAAAQAALEAAAAVHLGAAHGAELAALSAANYDDSLPFAGPDNAVLGGYDKLPRAMAAGLGQRLRLRTPVAAIRHGDSNASVVTAGGEQLTAQYVIATVPLGVLQAGGLRLDPPLPVQTQAALGRLGAGHLEKLWLEFDTAWWESTLCGSGELAAPCQQLVVVAPPANTSGGAAVGGWRRFISMAAPLRRPVLVAVAAADAAARWAQQTDAELVSSAMAALQALFPARAVPPLPRSYLLSRWGQDPWARGALSYYAVGGGPSDRATLAEPQSGSLLLAGEAAWVAQPSTAHGAYLSGQEAAYRVLDAAAELPQCRSGSGGGSGAGSCVAAPPGVAACSVCDELPTLPLPA